MMTKRNPTLFDTPMDGNEFKSNTEESITDVLPGRHEEEVIRFLEAEHGDLEEEEKLVVIFILQFLKAGHVCLPTDRSITELGTLLEFTPDVIARLPDRSFEISDSKIVGKAADKKPFIKDGYRLYIHRYYKMELQLKHWIYEKSAMVQDPAISDPKEILDQLFDDINGEINWQKVAVALSVFKPFLIISGGPGTGKTTTVARLLVMHQQLAEKKLKIALAAPTGKAAGRMGEALKHEMQRLDLTDNELQQYPSDAQTIHRLLRGVEERGLLPPARIKKLPYDIIIIDEASMIDLSLIHRLIKHLKPSTTLILLGDRDQLASVEAGSVFADLCGKKENGFRKETVERLKNSGIDLQNKIQDLSAADDSIVYLTKSYRFDLDSGIGTLADHVKKGVSDESEVQKIFSSFDDLDHLGFNYEKNDFDTLTSQLSERVTLASQISDPEELLAFWKQLIWLTVVRRGLSGSDRLNRLAEQSIATKRTVRMKQDWFAGRPIIVNRNDYDLGIFNGDFGVCIESESEENSYWVYVQSGSGLKRVRPERLQYVTPAFFLTVHKSQGSEFDSVNLLMPAKDVPILTKELLYTAITRARSSFQLVGSLQLFVKGSNRVTERFSGL